MATIEADVIVTKSVMGSEWKLWALVYMQVCAHSECPPELIDRRANELNPTGTHSTWRIAKKGPGDVDLSPVPCADDRARLHWMLSC